MKKLLLAGAVAIATLAGMTSCGGSQSADNNFNDSISTAFGNVNGAQLAYQYGQLPADEKAKLDKEQILAGIKYILSTDTANHGFITGLQIGMGMMANMSQIESSDVKFDRKKVYEAIAANFKLDSLNQDQMMAYQADFQSLAMKAQQAAQAEMEAQMKAEAEKKAQSPEAKKNDADGKAYIEAQKKADAAIKTTPSGLSYKITKEGTGDATPNSEDIATVIYTGRLIDGTEFDSSNGQTVDFPVGNLIPGFTEALKMMKKGEKMTIYIPGNLAYGAEGTPDGKIGPMSTLIFDVELVDFKTK